MSEQPRMRCGNDPRARLTPADQAVVDQFREYLAARAELGPEVAEQLFQALRRTELTTAQMSHLAVVLLPVVQAAVHRAQENVAAAEKDTRAPAGAPTGESTPLLDRGGEDL